MGIEPTPSAWKAEVLPLNYTRRHLKFLVEGGGFEPPKAEPTDLQSVPFGRSGTPPGTQKRVIFPAKESPVKRKLCSAILDAGTSRLRQGPDV